ncbi:hypothetical protein [Micromonospora sp. RP3T]|uniref:hypothetical protein n=1 Tax=Micromonospora sp. RP3T TaxID=2135446 RepID=UPI003D765553
MNLTKPGLRVAAVVAAVHLAHLALSGATPADHQSLTATTAVHQEQDRTKFDSESPQQEGGHRESAVGVSGNAASHVRLTPAVMTLGAVPVGVAGRPR